MGFMMRFFALLLVAVYAHVPSNWPHLPYGPLGVPGFPDCVVIKPRDGSQEPVLDCPPKPVRADQISIACIGDSITAGVHSSGGNHTYPGQLQIILGDKYVVTNYGNCGSTMLKKSNKPYWNYPQWTRAQAAKADIYIVMLGTNDAKDPGDGGPNNWNQTAYEADYASMLTILKALPNKPTVYAMIPPPLYRHIYGMNQTVINSIFPVLLPKINSENHLPHHAIDIFNAMGGHDLTDPTWFADGCHPNNYGYTQLATAVSKVIKAGLDL